MKMSLTRIKDVDYIIMSQMDDRTLLSYCQTDRYAQELCANDTFWKNRFVSKFGERYVKHKADNKSWKTFYLQIIANSELSELRRPSSDHIEEILIKSVGEWDVLDFFLDFFNVITDGFFFRGRDDPTDELMELTTDPLIKRLLDEGVASFSILKKLLQNENRPDLNEKVKKAIMPWREMSRMGKEYLDHIEEYLFEAGR